ncbi:Protein of unknown function [Pyronema omphalodes CBS 100304]|uniref:Uncharacterized protein n=1 Tax=Pyronema omphalodes (strain CBS 100304) TaxID=1076935 RepID=U4KZF9_PYROM|nr:Protein of unknown function [Pyronema omphalodes CBS 100304]
MKLRMQHAPSLPTIISRAFRRHCHTTLQLTIANKTSPTHMCYQQQPLHPQSPPIQLDFRSDLSMMLQNPSFAVGVNR